MLTRCILFATTVVALVLACSIAAGDEPDDCKQQLAALPKCECAHFPCLVADQVNAVTLQQRFSAEAARLATVYPDADTNSQQEKASKEEYKQFVKTVAQDLPLAPGYTGPLVVDYISVGAHAYAGQSTGAVASLQKMPVEEQCSRYSTDKLCDAVQHSVCQGMAEGILAHENYHVARCVALGGAVRYVSRTVAQTAAEESRARKNKSPCVPTSKHL
jgi:hypothetical protein